MFQHNNSMTKSNRIKHWQLNTIICYYEQEAADLYRFNLLELLKHLASIYKLDYAIRVDHQFSCEADSSEQPDHKSIFDLVYLRSNQYTRIQKKDFRETIDCMFRTVPSPFFEEVEVSTQDYKLLKAFPFPAEFYRPLAYPFAEHHIGSHKKLLIYADDALEAIEKEQDPGLN